MVDVNSKMKSHIIFGALGLYEYCNQDHVHAKFMHMNSTTELHP